LFFRIKGRLNIDIVGFGCHISELKVYVVDDEYKEQRKSEIYSGIKDVMRYKEFEISIIWMDSNPRDTIASIGEKLVTESKYQVFQESKGIRGYRPLGIFCKDQDDNRTAMTAGHVVRKDEIVFTANSSNNELEQLGTCNIHLGNGSENEADFAIVYKK